MILVVDNYDSSVYGLVQYVAETVALRSRTESWDAVEGAPAEVRRNDEIDAEGIRALDPDGTPAWTGSARRSGRLGPGVHGDRVPHVRGVSR